MGICYVCGEDRWREIERGRERKRNGERERDTYMWKVSAMLCT